MKTNDTAIRQDFILKNNHSKISVLGTGWLGLPLAKTLISRDYEVKGSTRTQERISELLSANILPYNIDLDKPNQNWSGFLDSEILIVNIPSKQADGFERLIANIKNSSIQKIIFISSSSVYPDLDRVISEDDNLEDSKLPLRIIEKLFLNNTNFKTNIIRFGGLVGYSRHPGRFFKAGAIIKNPDAKVNLIHRDDCINIISKILELDLWGEELNCCADSHPSKRIFYSAAALQCGIEKLNFEQNNEPSYKIISNQKVKKLLGYEFKYPDVIKIDFSLDEISK